MTVQLPALGEKSFLKLNHAVQQLANGRTNANVTVTLRGGQTTTVTSFVTAAEQEFVMYWQPMTASAAATIATVYCTGVTKGEFTLHHASTTSTDKTFNIEIRG